MFKYRILVWERTYPSQNPKRNIKYYLVDIPGHGGETKYGRTFPKDDYEEIQGWDRNGKIRHLCVLFTHEHMPFKQACRVINIDCLRHATWMYTRLTQAEIMQLNKEELANVLEIFTKINHLR